MSKELNAKIGISYADYYLGNKELSTDSLISGLNELDCPKIFDALEDYEIFVQNILNLESIRVETEKSVTQMLEHLMNSFFKTNYAKKEEIDFLILIEPRTDEANEGFNITKYLSYKFGLSCPSIVLSGNNCANIEYALIFAKSLLISNPRFGNILILGACKINNPKNRIITNYGVYGDGAGICLVHKNPILYIDDYNLINESIFYDPSNNEKYPDLHRSNYVNCIKDLLSKNQLSPQSVHKIFIQNANHLLFSQTLMNLQIEWSKVFDENLDKYGHIDCVDFFVNLNNYLASSLLTEHLNIISFGIGINGSYAALLLKNSLNEELISFEM